MQLLQDWVVKVCVPNDFRYLFIEFITAQSFIHIAYSNSLQVNDEPVTLPFLQEPYIYIERQSNTILLNTNIGLKVHFSVFSHLNDIVLYKTVILYC